MQKAKVFNILVIAFILSVLACPLLEATPSPEPAQTCHGKKPDQDGSDFQMDPCCQEREASLLTFHAVFNTESLKTLDDINEQAPSPLYASPILRFVETTEMLALLSTLRI